MKRIEVTLPNGSTIICHNQEHRTYLIAAHEHRECVKSIISWAACWLSPEQWTQYLANEEKLREKCDELWALIPDKDDLYMEHEKLSL